MQLFSYIRGLFVYCPFFMALFLCRGFFVIDVYVYHIIEEPPVTIQQASEAAIRAPV